MFGIDYRFGFGHFESCTILFLDQKEKLHQQHRPCGWDIVSRDLYQFGMQHYLHGQKEQDMYRISSNIA